MKPTTGIFTLGSIWRTRIPSVLIFAVVMMTGAYTGCTKSDNSVTDIILKSQFAGIERVVIQTSDISVRVAGHAASLVFVTLRSRQQGQPATDDTPLRMTAENDTLVISQPALSRRNQENETVGDAPELFVRIPKGVDIRIETQSGNIGVSNIDYAEISLQSSHGSFTIQNAGGVLAASTDSGDITLVEFVGVMHLSTVSGAQRGVGVLPSGDCRFVSASGPIGIEFADPLDAYKFDLRSETGVMRVGRTRSTGHFTMGNADITIFGATTTGSQTYR